MALGIDTINLVTEWLPRLEQVLSEASFAKSFQVHRVYVCAIELSTDEGAIAAISGRLPSFSVTQAALDWQPEEELDEGEVCSHLLHMGGPPQKARDESLYSCLSTSQRHFVSALSPGLAKRTGGRPASAFERKSFRLSTLEVYGIECQCPGYHVGATAFDGLLQEADIKKIPPVWWEAFLEDEGPQLLGRPARSAVLWQVQVDIVDLNTRNFSQPAPKRQRRYGSFLQVWDEPGWDPAAEARQYNGVRYRPQRRKFIAETRLPKRHNKVSFGDFKTCKEAARAIDAVFYYYGFDDKFNFADTPKILSLHPKPSATLDDDAKLKFVKEMAKIVASLAVHPPSSASAIAPPVARSPARSSVTVLTGSTSRSPESLMDAMPGSVGLLEGISQAVKAQSRDSSGYNVEDLWVSGHDRAQWNGDAEQGPAESRCFEFQDQAESSGDEFRGPASSHFGDFQGAAGSPCEGFQGLAGSPCEEFQGLARSPCEEFQGLAGSPCDEFQGSNMQFFCVQSPGPILYQTDSPWAGIQDDVEHVLLLQQQLGLDETALGVEQDRGVCHEPLYFQRNSVSSRGHAVDFSHSRQWQWQI